MINDGKDVELDDQVDLNDLKLTPQFTKDYDTSPLTKKVWDLLNQPKCKQAQSFDNLLEIVKSDDIGKTLIKRVIIDLTNYGLIINKWDDSPELLQEARPFIPPITKLIDPNVEWDDVRYHSDRNFRIRAIRAFLIIFLPIIFLVVSTNHCFDFGQVIGACLFFLFSGYFGLIVVYTFSVGYKKTKCFPNHSTEDSLHRVYSISRKPLNWANLNTSYINILYKNASVQSISELSAIYGAVAKVMLNSLGAYTWTSVVVFYVAQLYYNSRGFSWDPADYCVVIGTIGLLMISIFELDPFTLKMQICHYLGAAALLCLPTAYTIQQYSYTTRLPLAIVIDIITILSGIAWIMVGFATDIAQGEEKTYPRKIVLCFVKEQTLKNGDNKVKKINKYSRLNIGFEALALYCGSISLCLWLMDYQHIHCTENQLIGCADPVICYHE